jgi:hypothetical protein
MERLANRSSQRLIGAIIQEPNAISNVLGFAKFRSRSDHAVIRVYDEAGKVIETHEPRRRVQRVVTFYSLLVALPAKTKFHDSVFIRRLRGTRAD